MSMRSTRLIASATGSAALAIGLLALTPAPSADAATTSGTGTYTCTTPLGQSFQLPASISFSTLPDLLTMGVPVPAGTPFTLDLDGSSLTTALGATVLGENYVVNQLSTQIGTTPVTNTVTSPLLTQVGTSLLGFSGTLGGFTPQSPDLPLPVPTSFDLVGTLLGLPVLGDAASCQLNPAARGTDGGDGTNGTNGFGGLAGGSGSGQGVTVAKQHAKVRAHQLGRTPRVQVKVKNQTGAASGKVVAKLHGKTVGKGTLRHGTVKLKLKRLHKAVSRVNVVYRGDDVTGAAHKTVRVRTSHR